jgi:endonuclease YncB( thermonuclease family)
MDPDPDSGTQVGGGECRTRSSIYSLTGGLRGPAAGKSPARNQGINGRTTVDAFRTRLLSSLVVAALVAFGAGSGWTAEGGAAPAVPSATSEPAHSVPSAPPVPDTSQTGAGPTPLAASPSPPTGNPPTIAEWLNQTVRLRDTVEALDQPSSGGKTAGRIRAGAEVKAIGIITGRQWVQIELPDQRSAYIPSGAVELNDNSAARSPEHRPEPAAATTAGATSPETTSTPATVRGPVTRVPNAATLVVTDQRIRLLGIDPGPPTVLAPFESWIRAQGALACEPEAQTGRYRCFTASGVDVAEAAILNGAGRVGDGATPGYREREAEARQGHRGLWQGL